MKTKLLFFTMLFSLACQGQDSLKTIKKKNAVYFELLGNGLIYSINYERVIYQKNKFHLCGRAGLEAIPGILNSDGVFALPLELNVLLGKEKKNIELGIGYLCIPGNFKKETGGFETYYNYNATPDNNGSYEYSSKEINYYRTDLYFLRIGFRKEFKHNLFMRFGWTPTIKYLAGYKMEPYDKSFRVHNITNNQYSEHGPENYDEAYNKPLIYKMELGLLWGGISVGFRF